MKATSREPQSRVIAALTVAEVVRGPGVSSQGSRAGPAMSAAHLAAAENHEAGEHVAGYLGVARAATGGVEAKHAVDEAGEAGDEGGHGGNPRVEACCLYMGRGLIISQITTFYI